MLGANERARRSWRSEVTPSDCVRVPVELQNLLQDVVRIVAGTLGSVDNAIFPQNVLSVRRRLRSPIINSINSIFIISINHISTTTKFSSVKLPRARVPTASSTHQRTSTTLRVHQLAELPNISRQYRACRTRASLSTNCTVAISVCKLPRKTNRKSL